jgi:hypothetical protein
MTTCTFLYNLFIVSIANKLPVSHFSSDMCILQSWQKCYHNHSKIHESKINCPISGTFFSFDKTSKVENYCKENFKKFLEGISGQ